MSDAAIRAYATEKRFGTALLERWLAHATNDREELMQLVTRLRLGENQFRDILECVEDIAARRAVGIAAVLGSAEVAAVLRRSLGRNETLHLVKQALRRLRYPQLTEIETKLNALTERLRLPAGVRIVTPEHLEGDTVSVTVTARTAEQLRGQTRELAERLRGDEIDEMFRLLRGEW